MRKHLASQLNSNKSRIIFIQAHTGWGKTTAVARWAMKTRNPVYWIRLEEMDNDWAVLEPKLDRALSFLGHAVEEGAAPLRIIVLDDYYYITDLDTQNALADYFNRSDKNSQFIILSRKRISKAFVPMTLKGQLTLMDCDSLRYSVEEVQEVLTREGIVCTWDEVCEVRRASKGWPLGVNAVVLEYRENGNIIDFSNDFVIAHYKIDQYLEMIIMNPLNLDRRRFIMSVSLYSRFSLEMASVLADSYDAMAYMAYFLESGSYVIEESPNHYSILPAMVSFFENHRSEVLTPDEIQGAYVRIGHWFLKKGQEVEAIDAYFKGGSFELGIPILKEMIGRHPGIEEFYRIGDYLEQVPEVVRQESPSLCFGMLMVKIINYHIEDARREYSSLLAMRYTLSKEKQEAEDLETNIISAMISIPQENDDKIMLKTIWDAATHSGWKHLQKQGFTMTGNQPRLMAGSKDFTNWSRHSELIRRILSGPMEKIFGKSAVGLPATGCGEVYYQYNDFNRCTINTSKGIAESLSRGTLDIFFVGEALLIQMDWAKGEMESARDHLNKLSRRLKEKEHLKQGFEAFRIMEYLLTGDAKQVTQWLENQAPDESGGFRAYDRYGYLIKIRAYLSMDMTQQALPLIELMSHYASDYYRTYNIMETMLLRAICYEKLKEHEMAKETMVELLNRAAYYGFIRLIADEGPGCLPILESLEKEPKVQNQEHFKKVLSAARDFSEKHPKYYHILKIENEYHLTPSELAVIRKMDEGLSNMEIADRLVVSMATVKTHINRIYSKLNVKNRTQALRIARDSQII